MRFVGLFLSVLLTTGCLGSEDERHLELTFVGDGEGKILGNIVDPLTGDIENVECTESCTVVAKKDALVEIDPESPRDANFLGWDRNKLAQECRGTGPCRFYLYDDYEFEVEFSRTKAAVEVVHMGTHNLSVLVSGDEGYTVSPGGEGRCVDPSCLVVADVGSQLILGVEPADAPVEWLEAGTCGDDPVACTVPFSNDPVVQFRVEANKWIGIALPE